jgi:hypothetical protein
VSSQAQQWRKIIPLHSTRADVERLLGPSDDKGLDVYKLEDEVVIIQYSEVPCNKDNNQDWNVSPDTVINVIVSPRSKQSFSDLPIDKTKFKKKDDPHLPGISYYVDEDAGITYEVSIIGTVMYVSYGPKAKDTHLRCPILSSKQSCQFQL